MTDIGTPTPHYYEHLAATLGFRVEHVLPDLGEGYLVVVFDGTGSSDRTLPTVFETESEAHLAGSDHVATWKALALSNYEVMCTFGF